jgi:hypothetical protein
MENEQMAQAIKLLTDAGLKNVTKSFMLKKGNLMFKAPGLRGIKYALYANGYYRKYIPATWNSRASCYQLNRQTRQLTPWGWSTTGRIMIPGEYVLMATRIIAIYNKTLTKNK